MAVRVYFHSMLMCVYSTLTRPSREELHPSLGSAVQERHGLRGGPVEDHRNDQKIAERVGGFQSGEEEAPGRLYCGISIHKDIFQGS